MSLVRFNSFAPAKNLFDEMFQDFLKTENDMPAKWARFQDPLVNVVEEKDAYKIEMAIPGVNKKDVEIKVEKEQLIIKGTKTELKEETREHNENFIKREFNFGNFEKSFHIPDSVNREGIEASFMDGVLYIELKKKEEAIEKGPQRISIK